MHILIGSYHFYPFEGGAEKQGRLLARALIRRGCQVTYATAQMKGQPRFEIAEGLPICRVFGATGLRPGRLRPPLYFAALKLFLRRAGSEFTIFQSQGAFDVSAPAMLAAAHHGGQKTVVRYASQNEVQRLSTTFLLGHSLTKWLVRADHNVANSVTTLDIMLQEYHLPAARCSVIPNIVEPRVRLDKCLARRQLGLPEDATIVGVISNFHPGKNQDRVIQAWQRIAARLPQARLALVGTGRELEKCMVQAAQLGVTSSVIFAGYRTDVDAWLSALDVFLFSSEAEGQPNALLEAMAMGLPIAVADSPSTRSTLMLGTEGIGFDVTQPRTIADAVQTLLDDRDLARQMGERARVAIQTRHDESAIVQRYVDLYSALN